MHTPCIILTHPCTLLLACPDLARWSSYSSLVILDLVLPIFYFVLAIIISETRFDISPAKQICKTKQNKLEKQTDQPFVDVQLMLSIRELKLYLDFTLQSSSSASSRVAPSLLRFSPPFSIMYPIY
jgi:hypothetical protein